MPESVNANKKKKRERESEKEPLKTAVMMWYGFHKACRSKTSEYSCGHWN